MPIVTISVINYYHFSIRWLKVANLCKNSAILLFFILILFVLCILWITRGLPILLEKDNLIIVITPTYKRPERLAELTRFSQTLMHIKNLHWIVIEDGNQTSDSVERVLLRSRIPYVYFFVTTMPGLPNRGWTQRNFGLDYIRKHYKSYRENAVVYFADDDNTYDIRLFNNYIRHVRKIGVWAVGFSGSSLVEAPHVDNGTITKWDTVYAPGRRFAVDMAGFAVNIKLILNHIEASFHKGCVILPPESCFLAQFGIKADKIQPFGHDDNPKDILVWHTKTQRPSFKGSSYGYVVEAE